MVFSFVVELVLYSLFVVLSKIFNLFTNTVPEPTGLLQVLQ